MSKEIQQFGRITNERVNSSQTLVWFSLLCDFSEVGLHIYDRVLNAAPLSGRDANPKVSLRKFTEQSGRKSHNKENQYL